MWCSSVVPVDAAQYMAIASTRMRRADRSDLLIRLRVMQKPRGLEVEEQGFNAPSHAIVENPVFRRGGMIQGSLRPSSQRTAKAPVP